MRRLIGSQRIPRTFQHLCTPGQNSTRVTSLWTHSVWCPWLCLSVACLALCSVCIQFSAADEITSASEEQDTERVAIERFLTVLKRQPRAGTAFDRVYGFHVEHGTLDAFVETLETEARRNPADGSCRMLIGLIEMERGRDSEAIEAFQAAELLRPEDPWASRYLGRCLFRDGQSQGASAAFERALEKRLPRAEITDVAQDLSRAYRRSQQGQKAEALWARIEQQFPEDVRVLEQIAEAFRQEGNDAAALERYLRLKPLLTDPFQKSKNSLLVAELKFRLGRNQEAVRDLEAELRQLDPDSWLFKETRRKIEETFLTVGDMPGLCAYYESWIRHHPDDVDAMSRLGKQLTNQGKTAEATNWLHSALRKAPGNTELRQSLIELLVRTEDYSGAVAQYQELYRADEGNIDVIEAWGRMCLRQSRLPLEQRHLQASEIWRLMLKDRADDAVAVGRVARLFAEAGLSEQAISLYDSAVKLAPDDPQYPEDLGQYLHAQNRPEDALKVWHDYGRQEPLSKDRLVWLAETLDRFRYHDQALAAMDQACQLAPEFSTRIRYAEMLRNDRQGNQPARAAEALTQLNLAESLAETSDERELLLNERIECLQSAGQLEMAIETLSAELAAGKDSSPDRWRMLSRYCDSAGQIPQAIDAIRKSAELAPESVIVWKHSAALFEKAGRLADAVEALQTLIRLDRRSQAEYLRNIATLELRLGRHPQAVAAARELLAAAPGNPEFSRFAAELFLQLGQRPEALQTLRRCVRTNASDRQAILGLAEVLTEPEETAESIDLYWKAWDLEPALDGRLELIRRITEAALKTNQFDQVVQRLENQAGGNREQRQTAFCLAEAFQTAGDVLSARRVLERILTPESRDAELLARLSLLAETEGDFLQAAEFQSRINQLSRTDADHNRLASLLIQAGNWSEATQLWIRMAGSDQKPEFAIEAIDQLIAIDNLQAAQELCERLLAGKARSWEVSARLGTILWLLGEKDQAVAEFERLLAMNLELNLPASGQSSQQSGISPANSVYRFEELDLDSVRSLLGEEHDEVRLALRRSASRLNNSLTPGFSANSVTQRWTCSEVFTEYGNARVTAWGARLLRALETGSLQEFLSRTLNRQNSESTLSVWDTWFLKRLSGSSSPAERVALAEPLARQAGIEGQAAFLRECKASAGITRSQGGLYLSGNSAFSAGIIVSGSPRPADEIEGIPHLTTEQCRLLITSFESILKQHPDRTDLLQPAWQLLLFCRVAQQMPLLDELVQRLMAEGSRSAELQVAFQLMLSGGGQPEEVLPLADRVIACMAHESLATARMSSEFGSASEVTSAILLRAAGRNNSAECLQLLDWWISRSSQQRRPRAGLPPSAGTGMIGSARSFPVFAGHFSATDLASLQRIGELCRERGDSAKLLEWCHQRRVKSDGPEAAFVELVLSCLHWWEKRPEDSTVHLIRAVELLPGDAGLRMELAELCEQHGHPEDALKLLEQVSDADPAILKQRELRALELALAIKDKARARMAAERLFGMSLDAESEGQLKEALRRLGLDELTGQIRARTDVPALTRHSSPVDLLDLHESQGNTRAAVQVALQIVRRQLTSPSPTGPTRFSRQSSEDSLRTRAFDVLKKSGELDKLIARQRAQLEASPNSRVLLETVLEFLEAAGDQSGAIEIRERLIALRSNNTAAGLLHAAEQLAAAGKQAESQEKYLQLLERFPQTFWKTSDALTAIMSWPPSDRTLQVLLGPSSTPRHLDAAAGLIRKELRKDPAHGARLLAVAASLKPQNVYDLLEGLELELLPESPALMDVITNQFLPLDDNDAKSPRMGWRRMAPRNETVGDYEILLTILRDQQRRKPLRERVLALRSTFPEWNSADLILAMVDLSDGHWIPAEETFDRFLKNTREPIPLPVATEIANLAGRAFSITVWSDAAAAEVAGRSHRLAVDLLEQCLQAASDSEMCLHSTAFTMLVRLSTDTDDKARCVHLIRNRISGVSELSASARMTAASMLSDLGQPLEALWVLHQADGGQESSGSQPASQRIPTRNAAAQMAIAREKAFQQLNADHIAAALENVPSNESGENRTLLRSALSLTAAKKGAVAELTSGLLKQLQPRPMDPAARNKLVMAVETHLSRCRDFGKTPDTSLVAAALLFLMHDQESATDGSLQRLVPSLEHWFATLSPLPDTRPPGLREFLLSSPELTLICLDGWHLIPELRPAFDRLMVGLMQISTICEDPELIAVLRYRHGTVLCRFGDDAAAETVWSHLLGETLTAALSPNGERIDQSAPVPSTPPDIDAELKRILGHPDSPGKHLR